jgi:alpha-galactosidase/6-phospho-beta-glucosidase family protein
VPARHGLRYDNDTINISVMRGLRTIPVVLDIVREEAAKLVLNHTNPM